MFETMAPPTKGPATLLDAKTTPMIGVYFDISVYRTLIFVKRLCVGAVEKDLP